MISNVGDSDVHRYPAAAGHRHWNQMNERSAREVGTRLGVLRRLTDQNVCYYARDANITVLIMAQWLQ